MQNVIASPDDRRDRSGCPSPILARLFDLAAPGEVQKALTALGLQYLDDQTAELFVLKLVRHVASDTTPSGSPRRRHRTVATPNRHQSPDADLHRALGATEAPPQSDRMCAHIDGLKRQMKAAAAEEEFLKAAELKNMIAHAEELDRRRGMLLKEVPTVKPNSMPILTPEK
jgi:hypothetical protein